MSSHELSKLITEYFGGGMTSSGIAINSDNAMRMMTVFNCVRVLYNCVSQMPCQLMQEVDDVKSKAKDFYLYKILSKRPNQWMTAPQFYGLVIVHICLRGNFYAFISRVNGKIRELLPIHPDRVVEVSQGEDWSIVYKIRTPSGAIKDYSADKILHIRGISYDGFTGLNPIEYARECIALGKAGEKFLGSYFGRGMHPGAIIKHTGVLDPQTHANMREALKQKYAGLNKSQDLMLLEEGMDIAFPPIKLVDQQFIEEQRFTESQICGMFGVPLMFIQAGDNPETYASASEFKRTFVDLTLAPIAVNFETTLDISCLTDTEQDRYYSKFNLNSLLRGNITERYAAYAVGVTNKFLNANEVRGLEDLNPREGGEIYENPNTSATPTPNPNQNSNQGGAR